MWDGAINHLDMQALAPITHPLEMDEKLPVVLEKLKAQTHYRFLFERAFGDTSILIDTMNAVNYSSQMITIRQTDVFRSWLRELRDRRAVARIAIRIDRLAHGNAGDVRPVGAGVSELRIDYGPGYRVYFVRRQREVVILLCGGDKSSQATDIARALNLVNEV